MGQVQSAGEQNLRIIEVQQIVGEDTTAIEMLMTFDVAGRLVVKEPCVKGPDRTGNLIITASRRCDTYRSVPGPDRRRVLRLSAKEEAFSHPPRRGTSIHP